MHEEQMQYFLNWTGVSVSIKNNLMILDSLELWELQQNPFQFMTLKKVRGLSSLELVLRYLLHSIMRNKKSRIFYLAQLIDLLVNG